MAEVWDELAFTFVGVHVDNLAILTFTILGGRIEFFTGLSFHILCLLFSLLLGGGSS